MAQDLIRELHRRGIRLRLAGDRLDVLAPAGSLSPELHVELKSRRDELIALLRRADADTPAAEIVPHPEQRYEPFPLTDIQHAYWVGRNPAVELGGVATHFYFELDGRDLDPDRLTESLRKVIGRHDMLRAIIAPDGQQRVLPEVPAYRIALTDLRGLCAPDQQAEIDRLRAELGHQLLATDSWPLFDIRASRLDDHTLRLHISLDVLIMDAFSLYLLFQDWRRYYQDPDWDPAAVVVSYRDYVLAEQQMRADGRFRQAERYWLDRVDELPPPPALPLARQPGQLDHARFVRRRAWVPKDRWDAGKRIARERGITPSAVLLTAFADVLARWSRQSALTLNLTLFNRQPWHPRIGDVIGDFTSVTLLAMRPEPDDTFADRAHRVRRQLTQDLEHLGFSGVRVLRERARRLGGGPAAAMPVVFTSALVLATDDPGADMRFFGDFGYGITQTPQVWLDHQVTDDRGDLCLDWDAVESLFPAGMLDDMFVGYTDLVSRLCRDETAWDEPASLTWLPEWQRAERAAANDTATPIQAATLCELVTAQADRRPDALAVASDRGELTYRQLQSDARRLARCLDATPNTLVAVVLERGPEQVVAVLGVTLSGAAYLPVDPDWPTARRAQLLALGAVRTVVTSERLREELDWPTGIEVLAVDGPQVRAADPGPLATGPRPDDLAYVIFTSGSTGQPKGVMIDHRGAANTVQDINARFDIGPDDRVLALSALSFDLSVYDIFGILAAGGVAVLTAPNRAHDPAHWTSLVSRYRVTVWNSVPALMQAWLEAPGQADGDCLRVVLLSGDWIPVALPDAVRARCRKAEVISLGGATEASIWSVAYPVGEVPADWTRIPYGKPLANQTLQVYDERLRPCPVWTAGEIYIGGVGVARGYWADPERTAERFVEHPQTRERLYRTGDLGRYLPGGDIEFLGREDFQVKLNGFRIELGEIAAALRQQPGVAEAMVSVDTHPATGRRQLVAYVVPEIVSGATVADEPDDTWKNAAEAGRTEFRAALPGLAADLAGYRALWQTAEKLSPAVIARSLARLGVFTTVGDRATVAQIMTRGGVRPRFRGLLERWLDLLVGNGLLCPVAGSGGYRCDQPFVVGELDRAVRAGLACLDVSGPLRVLADYFADCAQAHVPMLRGQTSPLDLLLPGGSRRVTDALYADNPVSRLQNGVAGQVAASLARDRAATEPGRRPVCMLEVGAGTGATSAQVLPLLPSGLVRYRFTDVSTFFTESAGQRFRGHSFVEYGLLDIDRDPAAQGVPAGSVDVIIAANVVHDAKDLPRTLESLRTALAPGGVLLLVEATVDSPLQLVTVGFIEGFASGRSLLTAAQWRESLAAAGFAWSAAIPEADDGTPDVIDQYVLLAGATAGAARPEPARLRPALAAALPDYMVPHHYLVIDRLPLSANGKVDRSALPSPWDDEVRAQMISPRDELEHALHDIWSQTLGRDDFGVTDNFFDLGGDSLHAVRIMGRLADKLGAAEPAEAGLQRLFDSPTIAEYAASLRDRPMGAAE